MKVATDLLGKLLSRCARMEDAPRNVTLSPTETGIVRAVYYSKSMGIMFVVELLPEVSYPDQHEGVGALVTWCMDYRDALSATHHRYGAEEAYAKRTKAQRVRAAEERVLAVAEHDYDEYDGAHETALTLAVIELRKARAS